MKACHYYEKIPSKSYVSMTIDNKAKHEWEQDNFIKRIKSKAQLPNDEGWIEKKNQFKKE